MQTECVRDEDYTKHIAPEYVPLLKSTTGICQPAEIFRETNQDLKCNAGWMAIIITGISICQAHY